MAGDLTDVLALARRFEYNASKARSTFDSICEKYNRDFPDDDVIDLYHGRIVLDRGALRHMASKKIGCALRGQHDHSLQTSETDSNYSFPLDASVKSELLETTDRSIFYSENCSQWAADIGEESEPSDAETISSESSEERDDSWEDEDSGEFVILSGCAEKGKNEEDSSDCSEWLALKDQKPRGHQKKARRQRRKSKYKRQIPDYPTKTPFLHRQRVHPDLSQKRSSETRYVNCSTTAYQRDNKSTTACEEVSYFSSQSFKPPRETTPVPRITPAPAKKIVTNQLFGNNCDKNVEKGGVSVLEQKSGSEFASDWVIHRFLAAQASGSSAAALNRTFVIPQALPKRTELSRCGELPSRGAHDLKGGFSVAVAEVTENIRPPTQHRKRLVTSTPRAPADVSPVQAESPWANRSSVIKTVKSTEVVLVSRAEDHNGEKASPHPDDVLHKSFVELQNKLNILTKTVSPSLGRKRIENIRDVSSSDMKFIHSDTSIMKSFHKPELATLKSGQHSDFCSVPKTKDTSTVKNCGKPELTVLKTEEHSPFFSPVHNSAANLKTSKKPDMVVPRYEQIPALFSPVHKTKDASSLKSSDKSELMTPKSERQSVFLSPASKTFHSPHSVTPQKPPLSPFASPLPLVKIESPQQLTEVRRRFQPTCLPFSTQEINEMLELQSSNTFTKLLSQKLQHAGVSQSVSPKTPSKTESDGLSPHSKVKLVGRSIVQLQPGGETVHSSGRLKVEQRSTKPQILRNGNHALAAVCHNSHQDSQDSAGLTQTAHKMAPSGTVSRQHRNSSAVSPLISQSDSGHQHGKGNGSLLSGLPFQKLTSHKSDMSPFSSGCALTSSSGSSPSHARVLRTSHLGSKAEMTPSTDLLQVQRQSSSVEQSLDTSTESSQSLGARSSIHQIFSRLKQASAGAQRQEPGGCHIRTVSSPLSSGTKEPARHLKQNGVGLSCRSHDTENGTRRSMHASVEDSKSTTTEDLQDISRDSIGCPEMGQYFTGKSWSLRRQEQLLASTGSQTESTGPLAFLAEMKGKQRAPYHQKAGMRTATLHNKQKIPKSHLRCTTEESSDCHTLQGQSSSASSSRCRGFTEKGLLRPTAHQNERRFSLSRHASWTSEEGEISCDSCQEFSDCSRDQDRHRNTSRKPHQPAADAVSGKAHTTSTPSKLLAHLHLSEETGSLNLSSGCTALSRLQLDNSHSKTLKDVYDFDGTAVGSPQRSYARRFVPNGNLVGSKQPGSDQVSSGNEHEEKHLFQLPSPRTSDSHGGLSRRNSVAKSLSREFTSLKESVCAAMNASITMTSQAGTLPRDSPIIKSSEKFRFDKTKKQPESCVMVPAKRSDLPGPSPRAYSRIKPPRSPGRSMIHISSPHPRQHFSPRSFCTSSPEKPSQGSAFLLSSSNKRSWEPDSPSATGDGSNLQHKRRRVNSIHGTSTPRKVFIPGHFTNFDDTLSTIAGESSDTEATIQTFDSSFSEESDEEDEVTLIPE